MVGTESNLRLPHMRLFHVAWLSGLESDMSDDDTSRDVEKLRIGLVMREVPRQRSLAYFPEGHVARGLHRPNKVSVHPTRVDMKPWRYVTDSDDSLAAEEWKIP